MKKFLLTLSLLACMVPGMEAQDKLYLMVRNPYFGAIWEPGDNDPYLSLNSEGIYEGQLDLKKSDAFLFYLQDTDGVTTYGSPTLRQLQFNNEDVIQTPMEVDGNSPWMISKFNPQDLTEASVDMKVNLNDLTASFQQANVAEEVIDHVYVWGSSDWGLSYKMVAEMTQSAENENLFTVTVSVPEVGNYNGDPEYAPGADDPKNGYYMMLGVSPTDLYKYTRFTAPLAQKVVAVENDETFKVTLVKNTGASMIFLSYGEMSLTFNAETYEFTAEYADETDAPENPGGDNPGGDNPGGDNPGGDNPGGDNPGGDNPGEDNPGGDNPGGDNPGEDNPGGDNPGEDNPGGDNPGEDNPGSSSVSSLEISGSVTVYDLNGKNVFKGDASNLQNLNKGIYIVNGKKVVIK